ncbi:MAG: ATP-dependent RecD-like DNA helicase [Oscillospiraceae bacterium]|nr:ATP-dependent RecD-like DNA helicase [Oscillospiraceae bacterium]
MYEADENENKLKCLTADVEDVVFFNEETDYIVLDMSIDDSLFTAVGNMGDVREGERLTMYGDYITSTKYGKQFKVEAFERTLPQDVTSIRKYLGSGVIKGVGPAMAKKIVDAFGENTLEVLENDPVQLSSIKGIHADRAKQIGMEFHNITGLRKVMTFFSKYSIPHYVISAAWKLYGTDLIRAVESNPYCLCEKGTDLSFKDAEIIARDMKFPTDSEERIYAGIIWALREYANDGNCCVRESDLANYVTQNLLISDKLYYSALQYAESRGDIVNTDKYDTRYVYLSEYYGAECYIAEKISEMIKHGTEYADYSSEIAGIEQENGIEYDDMQKEALTVCMNEHVFILTGGPGTGKTTTLKALIALFKRRHMKIKLAAPTGRAAKRMADLTGASAQTIHRLLEVDFAAGGNSFKRNEENPLDCDAVIIDEMSMVDALLFASLLKALKSRTRLIMVGDTDQLPSVGAGNVLHDLLKSGKVPSVELTEVFRQAAESLIVLNAHSIIHGKMPELNDKSKDFFFMYSANESDSLRLAVSLCKKRLPDAYGYDPLDDIQVLCLSRIGTVGTENVNRELQAALNPPSKDKREMLLFEKTILRDGDKIMQTKNDYDVEWRRGAEKSHGIFNGDIGKILTTDRVNKRCELEFDGRKAVYDGDMLKKIEHAYAVTVHKSQGSEYPAVILLLPNQLYRLSYRNLLYTAITRAKKTMIVIGTDTKIEQMVHNDRRAERYSCLAPMLEDQFVE